jgi:hypothetical protein
MASLLGEDAFGRWVGIAQGSPWRAGSGARCGRFETSFVKLIPYGTFWTACFNAIDPEVDVDIVLPVRWLGTTVEEIDLELDVLRSGQGTVWVRDREEFDRVRHAACSA